MYVWSKQKIQKQLMLPKKVFVPVKKKKKTLEENMKETEMMAPACLS